MKNYKVNVLKKFNDVEENKKLRNVGDNFLCTKERYEMLKKHGAVELVEIIEETEMDLNVDPYESFESIEKETKKKKKSKK